MTTVKESWKKVGNDLNEIGSSIKGSDLGKDVKRLGRDFGKSVATTVKHGIRAVSEWAYSEDEKTESPDKAPDEKPSTEAPEPGEQPETEEQPESGEQPESEPEEKPVRHEIIYD